MKNFLMALAAALMTTSASNAATVPKFAGTYGITVATECASVAALTGMGVGKMTLPTPPGSVGHIAMNYQWLDRNEDGTVSQQTRSMSGRLKLTATTFVIAPTGGGAGPSGPMAFGALDGDGVAHTLNFLWTDFDSDSGLWCLHTLNATKQ